MGEEFFISQMARYGQVASSLLVYGIWMGLFWGPSGWAEEFKFTPNSSIQEFQNKHEGHHSYDFNAPPQGLFRSIQLAEGFEEELGYRRTHEIVPVSPTETFHPSSPVYIVFRIHQHYESFQVMGQCFPEKVEGLAPETQIAQDAMFLALEDESGYLKLWPPEAGWTPGQYKVEIHIGWEVNEISLMGTMRFTVDPAAPPVLSTAEPPTRKASAADQAGSNHGSNR